MTTTLDTKDTQWLKSFFGKNVKFNESMSKHTSLRVGGPADVFVTPKNQDQLFELIGWAAHRQIPYLVVGEGTNLLVKDKGIRAIIISLVTCLNEITKTDLGKSKYRVDAMAGASLKSLCRFAINNSLSGMNFAIGIPGTIGGSIKMNAGTSQGVMEDVLDTILLLLPDGKIQNIGKNQLDFSYRNLSLGSNGNEPAGNYPIILSGCFILNHTHDQEFKNEAKLILKDRKKKQPIGWASAGCFFKNPSTKQPAGMLMDQAGLKGKTKGRAKISTKHANFILNTGNATAADILWLMKYAQEIVFKQFNINLQPEVKIVGE
ncbi:MAG: UDP-N-acetylmuramate dehydrogenase [Deltaproteobacteria bacterium]|nr:UDP-N-acetylmuramate dehydrogenase [Deltaproteobacteria bacterium]MBW2178930.1 UDP-N-acetylmuramate dehydrogenase [Deltaproteobacteria bacterium]MBW2363530.1 UDP-N-acetylmuramate dehydrogenase [Deltaproteobacteria bacterium]